MKFFLFCLMPDVRTSTLPYTWHGVKCAHLYALCKFSHKHGTKVLSSNDI
jgi:hypothetical protein